MIELGRKTLLGKARARPDLVRRALEKARREGFWKTFQEATARLDNPVPLGYSLAGTIVRTGASAHGFAPGDRVACVGHPFASHAEYAAIPTNLVCKVPDSVSDEAGAFGMLGAIAMHGARSSGLGLGGCVSVIGLGLLGNLTAQILRAYGCKVIGMDPDVAKVKLCQSLGLADTVSSIEGLASLVQQRTSGLGCDAVIIAAATQSADPVHVAVGLCRQRARIVVLGVADIHPNRNDLWGKEVEIVVSKAGGFGALDPIYEIDGIDLPIGSARWTQGRNVEEFLRLIQDCRIDVRTLVTHRCTIAEAAPFYDRLIAGELQNAVAPLLTYGETGSPETTLQTAALRAPRGNTPSVAVLGGGQFARSVLLPAMVRVGGAALRLLATRSGITAEHLARKFGFAECTTDSDSVFQRSDIDAVVAPLPHALHARTVISAITAGKPLLVEKPLCISIGELRDIEQALSSATTVPLIMVGHNRRYSSHALKMRQWLAGRTQPLVMTIRVNAGFVPSDHWVHRESEGRSRIVGECSHFLDLAEYIAASRIATVSAMRVRGDDRTVVNNDNFAATLAFADGSVASLIYTGQGPRSVPREIIDIFSGGSMIQCTDFRTSEMYPAGGSRQQFRTRSQDYGYEGEIRHFLSVIQGNSTLEPDVRSAMQTMRSVFAIEEALSTGQVVAVG